MTIKELSCSTNFPIIELRVTNALANLVDDFDSPMKCDITNIKIDDVAEDVYCLYLNFKPYEQYNKSVAIPGFYDKDNNPTLTWFESPYYKDGKVEMYVQGTDTFEDFFIKKSKYELQEEFVKETGIWIPCNDSYPYQYTEWLEKKLLGE